MLQQLSSALLLLQEKEGYGLHWEDSVITVYPHSYAAIPIRFSVADDGTITARGVIGFYDSDYQRDLMVCESEIEKAASREGNVFGLMDMPRYEYDICCDEERQEVDVVSSFGISDVEENADVLADVINCFSAFAMRARMRFGHFIMESAKSRALTSGEERRFFSTLMCCPPPCNDGNAFWRNIDLADIVRLEERHNTFRIIHVDGADTRDGLRENLVKAMDGVVGERDSIILRYVFPEGRPCGNAVNGLIDRDGHDDIITRVKVALNPYGAFRGKRSPGYTATIYLFAE